MPIRVSIPQVNKWDVAGGVQSILAATHRYAASPDTLILDLSQSLFLSAEATALLASIFLDRQERRFPTRIEMAAAHAYVRRYLRQIGFLSLCDLEPKSVPPGSSLPLFVTRTLDKERVLRYIDEELMGRHEMPTMRERLRKDIRGAIFEVIGNVFYHSGSAIGAIVCGQIYPKANEIQVTFLDRGIGVAAKVRSCVDGIEGDGKALEWALQRGNSTLASGTLSRGLGLYLLREFIRANEGKFMIYANGAYFEETSRITNRGSIDPPLRGTLVDMRIKIRRDVEYGFAEEFEL